MADRVESVSRSPIALAEPWLDGVIADAVRAQVASGFVGPGPTSARFASELATVLDVPHVVLMPSGTVALTVAAYALGLQPGDEVLVPAYGVISTPNAFAVAGLHVRPVDVDPLTAVMDPACLRLALATPATEHGTRAVCVVNFSGYAGPLLPELRAICDEAGIAMIEDAACA